MPTYEYLCEDGHETEQRQSMSDDPLERCPAEGCEARAERQISAGVGVHGGSGGTASESGGAGACGPSGSAPT